MQKTLLLLVGVFGVALGATPAVVKKPKKKAISTISHLSELTSYWDIGNCGPAGDDHNNAWCGGLKTAFKCQKQVTVPARLCESTKANLAKVWGNGKIDGYKRNNCGYFYYAQYVCASKNVESQFTGLKIDRDAAIVQLGKNTNGPISIVRTDIGKGSVEGEMTFQGDIVSNADIKVNGTWMSDFIHRIMPTICSKGGTTGLPAGRQNDGTYDAKSLKCNTEWDAGYYAKQCATKGTTYVFDSTLLKKTVKDPLAATTCCNVKKDGFTKTAGKPCTTANFVPDVSYWQKKCDAKAAAAEFSAEGTIKPSSCWDVKVAGGATGVHTIWPDGKDKASMSVYCDNSADGGGWALGVVIDGNDEDHSNTARVGISAGTVIKPGGNTRKYSDATLNKLMNPKDATASIRMLCGGQKAFWKQCTWSATKGLPTTNSPCVKGYNDEKTVSVRFTKACNTGSQGVGSHCSCPGGGKCWTYCSHCDRGQAAGTHNRKGCGHDSWGYSKSGQVWYRKKSSSTSNVIKYRNCADVTKAGKPTGQYNVYPDGPSKAPMGVYCDTKTDGGGWTLVVVIDGNDEDHSNTGRVGIAAGAIITPGGSTRKYSDATINKLMNKNMGPGSIRSTCGGQKAFFKGCTWSATKGLPTSNSPCVKGYNNQEATSVRFTKACNTGSQGIGSHCSCPGGGKCWTYCSHCDRGQAAGTHNRKGCGHDSWGYSKSGEIWVRSTYSGISLTPPPPPAKLKSAYKFDKAKVTDSKTRGCIEYKKKARKLSAE